MSYSFYIALDLDLRTLSKSTLTIEELLTAFIESTSKHKKMLDTSYKVEIRLSKSNNSVCPEREQKANTLD